MITFSQIPKGEAFVYENKILVEYDPAAPDHLPEGTKYVSQIGEISNGTPVFFGTSKDCFGLDGESQVQAIVIIPSRYW